MSVRLNHADADEHDGQPRSVASYDVSQNPRSNGGPNRDEISGPLDELRLALATLGGRATAAELAQKLGVSSQRVRLLAAFDEEIDRGQRERSTEYVFTRSVEPADAQRELRELAARQQIRRRRRVDTRAEQVVRTLSQLDGLVRAGRMDRAVRLVRERGLTARVALAGVPPTSRDRLSIAIATQVGRLWMIRGEPRRALRALGPATTRAVECRDPSAPAMLATLGAAHRMIAADEAPRHLAQALDCYQRALEEASRRPPVERRRLERWIFTSRSGPFVLLGAATEAERHLDRAMDRLEDDPTDTAETMLAGVRGYLAHGRLDEAHERLESARVAFDGLPWVIGWFHRYESDVWREAGNAEAWARAIAAAWQANRGHGFQQKLIAARLAVVPEAWIDVLPASIRPALTRFIGELHIQRFGERATDGCICRRSLRTRAQHVFGLTDSLGLWR